MKRREFIVSSASLVGTAALPAIAKAASAPCPPPQFGVVGGSSVASDCTAGGALEADWIARSTGEGVIWAHDFRYQREVDQFRSSDSVAPYATSNYGNDPNGTGYHRIFWDSSDGIGNGKCLRTVAPNGNALFPASTFWQPLDSSAWRKAHFPAGTTFVASGANSGTFTFPGGSTFVYNALHSHGYGGPTNTTAVFDGYYLKFLGLVSSGGWARPFSALIAGNTGNGLPTPDLASGGETRRTFNAATSSAFGSFRAGYYGKSIYHTAGGGGSTAADWDGTEFYLQFRVKFSSGRHDKRTPPTGAADGGANVAVWNKDGIAYEFLPSGKLVFIQPGPDQIDGYIIIQSGEYQHYAYRTAPFRMYSGRGTVFLQDPQVSSGSEKFQNVAPHATTCVAGGSTWLNNACWEWPENEWVTVLFYMKPGGDNVGQGSNQTAWPHKDTHVRVWVARAGVTSYTEIFNKSDLAFNWGGSTVTTPAGSINNVDFSCYMNNLPAWKGFEQKYTQAILSKSFIPCPAV